MAVEQQDVLTQIYQVLEKSALTEEDKRFLPITQRAIDRFKSNWVAEINDYQRNTSEVNLKHLFGRYRYFGSNRGLAVETFRARVVPNDTGTGIDYFPGIIILGKDYNDGQTLTPTESFRERVLTGLGVLKDNQSLEEFCRELPIYARYQEMPYKYLHTYNKWRGNQYQCEVVRALTNINGVYTRFHISDTYRNVYTYMDLDQFEVVINPHLKTPFMTSS